MLEKIKMPIKKNYICRKERMKKKKNNNFIKLIFILLLTYSCASKKNYHYFNSGNISQETNNNFSPKIKTGDLLDIQVLSFNKESVEPFNLPIINSNIRAGYSNGISAQAGYLVDENGNVSFPVIGDLKVSDYSTIELADILKNKLKDYVQDPIVHIKIENFKITVLGEVRNPGTFQIPNERITIFEAIGLAGDLTINGIRKEITLIRDFNGKKEEVLINLTSKDLISSNYYYLSQNDVLYVKPNQAKVNSSTMSSSYGMFISIASLIITTINVLTK